MQSTRSPISLPRYSRCRVFVPRVRRLITGMGSREKWGCALLSPFHFCVVGKSRAREGVHELETLPPLPPCKEGPRLPTLHPPPALQCQHTMTYRRRPTSHFFRPKEGKKSLCGLPPPPSAGLPSERMDREGGGARSRLFTTSAVALPWESGRGMGGSSYTRFSVQNRVRNRHVLLQGKEPRSGKMLI